MDDRLGFADFELDLGTGELLRDGRAVQMERQPARVLTHLASRAGHLVTRDELRDVVWGRGTFVDFDRGLNYCIRHIRVVLGDDARAPRFVQTVPRQGYRFIATVSSAANRAPAPRPPRRRRGGAVAAVAACAAILAVALHERNPAHHDTAVAALRAVHDWIF